MHERGVGRCLVFVGDMRERKLGPKSYEEKRKKETCIITMWEGECTLLNPCIKRRCFVFFLE